MPIQSTRTREPSVRTRTRPTRTNTSANPGKSAGWMSTGSAAVEGQQKAKQEAAAAQEVRQAQMNMPYRFSLKPGEEADIVILDRDLGPAFWEHDLTWNPDFRKNRPGTRAPVEQFIPSCREWEEDPLMRLYGLQPSYVMFLSVIDMRSGVSTRTGKEYGNVRKLLAVKGDAMDQIMRIRELRISKGGDLRGVQLVMARSSDSKSLRTGLPTFVDQHSEQDIIESFKHDAVKNEAGEVVKEANADCFPYDYESLFGNTAPSAAMIIERLGLKDADTASVPGSDNEFTKAFSGGGGDDAGDEGDTDGGDEVGQNGGGAQPPRSSSGRIRPSSNAAPTNFSSDTLDDDIPF
jgi:hypothetical protein